jgi:hypothetical protein
MGARHDRSSRSCGCDAQTSHVVTRNGLTPLSLCFYRGKKFVVPVPVFLFSGFVDQFGLWSIGFAEFQQRYSRSECTTTLVVNGLMEQTLLRHGMIRTQEGEVKRSLCDQSSLQTSRRPGFPPPLAPEPKTNGLTSDFSIQQRNVVVPLDLTYILVACVPISIYSIISTYRRPFP